MVVVRIPHEEAGKPPAKKLELCENSNPNAMQRRAQSRVSKAAKHVLDKSRSLSGVFHNLADDLAVFDVAPDLFRDRALLVVILDG